MSSYKTEIFFGEVQASNKTYKTIELYRAIFEIQEKKIERELRKMQEIEVECGMLEGSKKVNSADQIGQRADLRFKTEWEVRTYQWGIDGI